MTSPIKAKFPFLWLLNYNSGNFTVKVKEKFLSLFFSSSPSLEVINQTLERKTFAGFYLSVTLLHESLYNEYILKKKLDDGVTVGVKEVWPNYNMNPTYEDFTTLKDYYSRSVDLDQKLFMNIFDTLNMKEIIEKSPSSIDKLYTYKSGYDVVPIELDSEFLKLQRIIWYNRFNVEKFLHKETQNVVKEIEGVQDFSFLKKMAVKRFRALNDKGVALLNFKRRAAFQGEKGQFNKEIENNVENELIYLKQAPDDLILGYLQELASSIINNEYFSKKKFNESLLAYAVRRSIQIRGDREAFIKSLDKEFELRFLRVSGSNTKAIGKKDNLSKNLLSSHLEEKSIKVENDFSDIEL